MPKAYLVVGRDYTWNDEYLEPDRSDESCSNPMRVFDSREEAEAVVRTLSLPRFRGITLTEYAFETLEDITSLSPTAFYQKLSEVLQEPALAPDGEAEDVVEDIELPSDLSEEQLIGVIQVLDRLRFYDVVESTTSDEAALEQARTLINAGVAEPREEYEAYRYLVPQQDISAAVSLFGLHFSPNEGPPEDEDETPEEE